VINLAWIQKLYETYENNLSQIGIITDDKTIPLIPVCHMLAKAHIEIIIDIDGNFIRASILPKSESDIIIPCSEKSAGRTRRPEPHPLCDKIQYLAGDYAKYEGTKDFGFEGYKELISAWASSEFKHPKVVAIQKYITKEIVIDDLVKSKVLIVDDKNGIRVKLQGKDNADVFQDEAFIRWQVEEPGVNETRVWMDFELYSKWTNFYLRENRDQGFCLVLNKEAELAHNHPKSIHKSYAKAKIISSNDNSGFTFRGRFSDAKQAYSVSYEATQKSHNALKWLISKQGYNKGNKSIVCWSVKGNKLPDIMEDGFDLMGLDFYDSCQDNYGYTGEELAHKLKKRIQGYGCEFQTEDTIIIMAVEAITDGRLSITFYQELIPTYYIERINLWHETCSWIHEYRKKEFDTGIWKTYRFVGAPSPFDIAGAVHGYGKNSDEDAKIRVLNRILACIIGNTKIPYDIISIAVNKTSNRLAFENQAQFDKAISVTCALYNKFKYDYYKEVYAMSLEEERRSRDYLYGRLLAVAQNIEQWALTKSGENRMTNADRLMNRFAESPYSTWKNIELSLKPYLAKLQGGGATSREILLDNIMCLFEPEDFINDTRLSGEFLLGYHCQRERLKTRKAADRSNDFEIQNENMFEEE
jgi:CRISPR-associated protein Csd1